MKHLALAFALLTVVSCGDSQPVPEPAVTPAVAASVPPVAAPPVAAPLATAPAPLPVFLPAERPLPALGAPLQLADLRVDLGGGKSLTPAQFTPEIPLDGMWRCSGLTTSDTRFADDAQLDRGYQAPEFADAAWKPIAVPLDWYRAYPKARDKAKPFVLGWYRKEVELGAEAVSRHGVLHFGVVGYEADLWVNGTRVGTHHGDFTPWEADVSGLLRPGTNLIALRVRSDFGPNFGASGPAWHVYGSQWSIDNIKGGLWQSVSLRLEQPLRVAELLITPKVASGTLRVDWRIVNHSGALQRVDLRTVVQGARQGGERVGDLALGAVELQPGDNSGSLDVPVPGLRTWSPDAPHLYWLTLLATHGGTVVGARSERFGFREFVAKEGRFALNGTPLYLAGMNLPAKRFGGQGLTAAHEAELIDHELTALKTNGCNIVRLAHMPVIPALLWRADELGMMIYDEWGWAFTEVLDPQEFPRRNAAEITDWVRRDYNHPSVVMWSCGNEVDCDKPGMHEELDRQVVEVRGLDHSGRPVSTSSGSAYGYGTKKQETDVLDLHSYLGLGSGPWTGWQNNAAIVRKSIAATYGAGWSRSTPFIVWECVGFSWGDAFDPDFRTGDPEAYLAYTARPTSWGKPNGIGFSGSIGLAAALDPQRGALVGRCLYGRRIGEAIRRDPGVAGFAPWFDKADFPEMRQWTQPVFASLAGVDQRALRHPLAGSTIAQTLLVDNRGGVALSGATARLSLMGGEGGERGLATLALPMLAVGQRVELPVSVTLPPATGSGWWQLRVRILVAGVEVSCLGYELFVTPPAHAPLATPRPVAVLPGGDVAAVQRWLKDLAIPARSATGAADLAGAAVAIIPPGCALTAAEGLALRSWVRGGGSLLVMEQPLGAVAAIGLTALPAKNTLVDLVVPAHPLFAGLGQEAFDTSDRAGGGWWVATGLSPITVNVLAAKGPFLGNSGASSVVAEGTLGRGRILATQLLALDQWGSDSVATVYLRNLAAYYLSTASTAAGVRPWIEPSGGLTVAKERCVALDLRMVANRAFTDERADDGIGGWTDQGSNDFRMMPLGYQVLQGVPFTIIDPAANNGRSCVVLGGGGRPAFPHTVESIVVGMPVSRLFFLHTAAWVGGGNAVGMTYRVHYADGQVVEVPVRAGREIADWWSPGDLPNACLGLSRTTAQEHDVGLFLMPWENPRPAVAVQSIDVVSSGKMVPIVVAITAERANPQAASFAPADRPAAWHLVVDRPGQSPDMQGPGLPIATPGDDAPDGAKAVRLAFPASLTEPGAVRVPAAFLVMDAAEKAKLASGTYHHLTCWIKADGPGTLTVVLPRQDWKDTLKSTIRLDAGPDWRRMRLALGDDFKLGPTREWTVKELRGELFLFNGQGAAAGDRPAPAVTVQIADPRLE